MTHSQCGNRFEFDVLVIGSGIAGLNFTLELSKHAPNTKIALITKNTLTESSSHYAQGGIAAAAPNADAIQKHIVDTLAAGDGLCDIGAVQQIIQQSFVAIQQLQNYGVQFDLNAAAEPDLAQEGGHSQRRIFHCGDQTGAALIDTLSTAVKQLPNVSLFEYHTAINLISSQHDVAISEELNIQPANNDRPRIVLDSSNENAVLGAYILNEQQGLIHTFLAKIVILATGGVGKVYRYTSNPEVATGDGIALAYRAGARVYNMEFYQFHPTVLYHHSINNFLISEAVRGEGAYLRLVDTGERFMQRYAPIQMELATRDVVARAIFTEIEHNAHNCVHLDITHKPRAFLAKRFPTIFQTLLNLGIDMSQDPIPVVPAAHYLCGGVLADVQGKTDIARLYAIGETACTGFHGANRLASNSLLEGMVMAKLAAKDSLPWLAKPIDYALFNIRDWDSRFVTDLRRASQINAHWRGLRGEMTSYAGIVRTEAGLKDVLRLIQIRREIIEEYYWKHIVTRDLIELRNIALVAELIVRFALQRCESRGGHYREDYPQHG
ncbi:L-aspartate oxidase [soil metagenome]